jgi:hypothetical protein
MEEILRDDRYDSDGRNNKGIENMVRNLLEDHGGGLRMRLVLKWTLMKLVVIFKR